MQGEPNIKSYSYALHLFMMSQSIGYTFTTKSLFEDFNTCPTMNMTVSYGAVTSWTTSQFRRGAFGESRRKTKGSLREYTLVDRSKLHAVNKGSVGGKVGRTIVTKRLPDGPQPVPVLKVADAASYTIKSPVASTSIDEDAATVLAEFKKYVARTALERATDEELMAELRRRMKQH